MRRWLQSWWKRRPAPRPRPARRLWLEPLEDRTVLNSDTLATAAAIPFTAFNNAHASGFLATANAVDLFRVQLQAGDQVNATVSAQTQGSGLASILRVFGTTGTLVALDDQEGGDPQLTFQAATTGDYYIGVSADGNDAYKPTVSGSGSGSDSHGLFSLNLRRTPAAPLLPDLAGAAFRLDTTTAAYGDTVSGTVTVDNRGGADAGAFDVQVVLSGSNVFGPSSFVLTTFSLPALGSGQEFSSGGSVTLPDLATATGAGLPFSGPVYVGLRIDPAGAVPESNPFDQSGVHRGEDWETLTVVTPVPAGVTDLSKADPGLNTESEGTLLTPAQADTYSFTVTQAQASGRLTAAVTPTAGTLTPLLTLAGPDGDVLIQSSSQIVQYLQPGSYSLTVSARSGAGAYRLTTQFLQVSPPGDPLAVGFQPDAVAVADLTGDGIPDIVTANGDSYGQSYPHTFGSDDGPTVSVLLGNGDGTFQNKQTYTLYEGFDALAVAVADLTGDGIPDIITANNNGTLSVLQGNGDGTFQQPQTLSDYGGTADALAVADLKGDGYPEIVAANGDADTVTVIPFLGGGYGFARQPTFQVGGDPDAVAVADLTGDGIPDIITANGDGTVSVLLGNGDGTFQPQQTFAVGPGADAVAVADLTGNGIQDIITANGGSYDKPGDTVSVLLGNGDGTFQPQQTFQVGSGPGAVAVADLTDDGKPDIIAANRGEGYNPDGDTVSVLLGNGDGTFQPQHTFQVGSGPSAVAVADLSGNGIPDIITANASSNTVSVLPGNGDGTFQAEPAFQVGANPDAVAAADLTGNGKPDIVTANRDSNTVSVLLGNGDGTFQPQQTFPVGSYPDSVALADLNGDGKPDIVTANENDSTVSVLLGNGDGTFQPQQTFTVGAEPDAAAVADLTGNGIPDIITANDNGDNGTVSVLLGNGDGTFQPPETFPVGDLPSAVAVADLNGDGIPDIITVNTGADTVSVLLGNGDGTFQPQQTFPVGLDADAVAVADLTGDGIPDIITANGGNYGGTVSVSLGNGDGTFQPPNTFQVGPEPSAVAVADLTGDDKLDIITANADGTVSVLLGNGDGTFQPRQTLLVGADPTALAVADLTGDGKPDIITANASSNTVSVLLGTGRGVFELQPQQTYPVGGQATAVAVADLTGDGIPDIITANFASNTVSVLPGNGDGTFQPQQTLPVGEFPGAVAVADLTGNGIPDIVTANENGNGTVSVLLGNGDGTFQPPETLLVGGTPDAVAVADLTGDGIPDIITADDTSNTVSVLLGNGDGTFQPPQTFPVGSYPDAVAVADLTGDGIPDIITANSSSNTVSVLLGNGDGTFQPPQTFSVGSDPFAVAVADLTGDGIPDIITANFGSNTVSVLLGNGDGTFQPQQTFAVGSYPAAVAVADLTGDGKPAIITANSNGTVSVLLGNGDGTFQQPQTYGVGDEADALAVADLTGDGKLDIVTANGDTVSVLLAGEGVGFTPSSPTTGVPLRNTPILADLTGDGIADSVVLDSSGDILFRKGLPGSGDQFAPPVILNPGRPARDLALIDTPEGPAIAAADTDADPSLASPGNPFVYTVSLYTVAGDGTATRTTAFSTPFVPTRIAAGDLTGNGLDDLVVADSFDNRVQVAFQQPDRTFSAPLTLTTGEAPSGISLTDVNGDGLPDIVVTNQASGDVTVFLNDAGHTFATSYRLRAGLGTYSLDPTTANVSSQDQPVSLAAGDFTGDGRNDLVVVNRGSHSFTVLQNDGDGGFRNPTPGLTTSTSDGLQINNQPGPVVAGYFSGPDQPEDLAILMEDTDQVWIFTGDGHGQFTHTETIAVGSGATGLSVVPGSGPGLFDLLVGDQFGDILQLVGKGDGTFEPPPPLTGTDVPFAVQSLQVNGVPDVLVADQAVNSVTIQAPVSRSHFTPIATLSAADPAAQLAPGAVQFVKLEGAKGRYFDAVVVASGSNDLLIYRGTGFDAEGRPTFQLTGTYSVGDDPVSVTFADLTGKGILDMLVADKGSNDIAEFFGSIDPTTGDWVATPGPRLKSGGSGPVAVDVRHLNGSAKPDLVVTNSDGTVAVLPGVGQGFFNDQNPQVLTVPDGAGLGAPSFAGNGDIGLATTAAGDIVRIDLDTFTAELVFTATDGVGVNALEALADGEVIAALSNGTVADLLADASGQLGVAAVFAPLDGQLTDPSNLQAFDSQAGLQVLVTNANSDQVFVFAPLVPAGPVIEVTSSPESSLTLVVTVFAGGATLAAPAPDIGPSETSTGTNPINVPAGGAAFEASPDPGGGGDSGGTGGADGSADAGRGVDVGYDVDEQLRQSVPDLALPAPTSDGPSSRREVLPVPEAPTIGQSMSALDDLLASGVSVAQPQVALGPIDVPADSALSVRHDDGPSNPDGLSVWPTPDPTQEVDPPLSLVAVDLGGAVQSARLPVPEKADETGRPFPAPVPGPKCALERTVVATMMVAGALNGPQPSWIARVPRDDRTRATRTDDERPFMS